MGMGDQSIGDVGKSIKDLPKRMWQSLTSSGSKGSLMWFLFAILLYVIDWYWTHFDGINTKLFLQTFTFQTAESYIRTSLNLVALGLVIFYWIWQKPDSRELISFAVLAFLMSFTITIGYGNAFGTLTHLAFAIAVLIGLAYPQMDKTQANYMIALAIFIDFYLFSLIGALPGLTFFSRLIIPIWVFITAILSRESTIKNIIIFIIIMFYIFTSMTTYFAWRDVSKTLTETQYDQAGIVWGTAKDNFMNFWKTGWKQFQDAKNESQRILSGDVFYESQVDQYAAEPLGVFFEDVKLTDEKYEKGDTVFASGRLKVSSIEQDIPIIITCFAKSSNGTITKGDITPNAGVLRLYNHEEEYVMCNVQSLDTGTYTVGFNVTYNFTTMAYLKTYFIDKERKRAMAAKSIDVFQSYGITDTQPSSIYTAGPVKVGIGTVKSLPIPVNTSADFNSFIGVSFENLNEGKIKNINSFMIEIPNGTKIDVINKKDCNENFSHIENSQWYNIDEKSLKRASLMEIRSKSIYCNLRLTDGGKEILLGNTPISIRYFKVNTSYTYLIEKSVSVTIKKSSVEEYNKIDLDGECDTNGFCKKSGDCATGNVLTQITSCQDPYVCCKTSTLLQSGATCNTSSNAVCTKTADCSDTNKVASETDKTCAVDLICCKTSTSATTTGTTTTAGKDGDACGTVLIGKCTSSLSCDDDKRIAGECYTPLGLVCCQT